MPDPIERTSTMHPHARTALATVCSGLVALSAAGCGMGGADGATSSTSTATSSSSSSSSTPTYDAEYAYDHAEKAIRASDKHDITKPLSEDDKFASQQYIHSYNQELQNLQDKGVTQKGKITTTSVHPKTSNKKAPGGWDLTMYVCSTSTVRYISPEGKDVTGHPVTGEPLPKRPVKGANLVSFTTPDHGKTWQIANIQLLTGKSAKESPCKTNL